MNFFIAFLPVYFLNILIFVGIFGNMSFFGEQGSSFDIDMLFSIMSSWALFPAAIFAAFICKISEAEPTKTNDDKKSEKSDSTSN